MSSHSLNMLAVPKVECFGMTRSTGQMTGGHALGLTRAFCEHTYLGIVELVMQRSHTLCVDSKTPWSQMIVVSTGQVCAWLNSQEGSRKCRYSHTACAQRAARRYGYAIETVTEQQDSRTRWQDRKEYCYNVVGRVGERHLRNGIWSARVAAPLCKRQSVRRVAA